MASFKIPAFPETELRAVFNYLYEDLFDLPGNVAAFVRMYFLRRAYRYARQEDHGEDTA